MLIVERDVRDDRQVQVSAGQTDYARLRRLVDILQYQARTVQGFLDYVLEQAIQLTATRRVMFSI